MKDGLKAMRKLKGYTQRKLAELSGIPASTIENWEMHGAGHATAENLKKVADVLECRMEDLF